MIQTIISKPDWELEFETIPFDDSFPPKAIYPDESRRVQFIFDTLFKNGVLHRKTYSNDLKFKYAQSKIHSLFQVPWTAFSRPLEQFLFNLPNLFQIKRALIIGCGWGVASGFLANGINNVEGNSNAYDPQALLINLDINNEVTQQAKNNIECLSLNNLESTFLICDFQSPIFKKGIEFDLIFLDADGPDNCEFKEKKIYNVLIKHLYPYLRKGGLLIAHDVRWAKKQIKEYLSCVRDSQFFSHSFEIHLDVQGIEISQK